MSAVLLLVPMSPDDVLRRSRWIADRTAARLMAHDHEVDRLEGARCVNAEVVHATTGDGVAIFGHGQADHIQGSDERPLYSGDAASALRGRWVHALACEAAEELGPRLVRAGASSFVGYRNRLTPRWGPPEELPPALVPLLEEVVTCVTVALAAGEDRPEILKARLSRARDAVTLWLEDNPGDYGLLSVFCTQLVNGLRQMRPMNG